MQAKLIICIALVALVALTTAKECKTYNDCATEQGKPICALDYTASANATTKMVCMACNPESNTKDCHCGLSQICYNVKGQSEYGTCVAPDTSKVGQFCSNDVNSVNLKKDENEKAFCGQYVEKDSKYTVLWEGVCDKGVCQRCRPGSSSCTTQDSRYCLSGQGYTIQRAGTGYSWNALFFAPANLFLFLAFVTVLVLAPLYCFKTFKK